MIVIMIVWLWLWSLSCPKSSLWKKSFSIILKLEMILSVVSYERKNILYEKNLKLTKNNTFNNVLWNRIFSYNRFLAMFKKSLDFHKIWIIFLRKIFSTILLYPISLSLQWLIIGHNLWISNHFQKIGKIR